MELIYASGTLALLLLIWFETEAFTEYMRMFYTWLPWQVAEFFLLIDYFGALDDGMEGVGYLEFLRAHGTEHFHIRLLTCPICLGVWLGVCLSPVFGLATCLPSVALGLLFYRLLVLVLNHG